MLVRQHVHSFYKQIMIKLTFDHLDEESDQITAQKLSSLVKFFVSYVISVCY